jgi:RNA chaperone Hfq
MNTSPFDEALEEFYSKGAEAAITLKDGSELKGRIKKYDGYVIFLDNGTEMMVYRHSILKLSEAAPQEQRAEKAQARPRQAPRPAPARMPQNTPGQKKRPPRKEPFQAVSQQEPEPGGISRMGEELLKWLKSQKGNE